MTDKLTAHATINGVWKQIPLREKPLAWQTAGLQQTASGYGKQLTTPYMVEVRDRWRRVYVTQYSNAGTAWFMLDGVKIVVNIG